eukprot:3213560-Amphidinium_carterae.1
MRCHTYSHAGVVRYPAVELSLAEKKYEEMRGAVKNLLNASGMVAVAIIRKLAGQLSWASGMF